MHAAALPEHAAAVRSKQAAVKAPETERAGDKLVHKYKGELKAMIKEQDNTQSEVSSLAQQMKAMMNSQTQLNKQMAHAFTEMGTHTATTAAAPVQLVAKPSNAAEMSFEKGETDNIHKILRRELSRLNLDQPMTPVCVHVCCMYAVYMYKFASHLRAQQEELICVHCICTCIYVYACMYMYV